MSEKPVRLLWGEHAFLLREASQSALADVRAEEVDARSWKPGSTGDLATPSLFGEPRALLITEAQDLPAEALDELKRYTAEPSPDTRLVLTYTVGPRAKGPTKKILAALGEHVEVRRVAIERRDLPGWILQRAKELGVPASSQGVTALVQTLGEDPGVLDQAVQQLRDSHAGEGITPETVGAQFQGLGDRRIWDLCDAAFGGDLAGALRTLAAMLEAGDEGLPILGGIASRLRDLIRVRGLPARIPPREAARIAGLRFEWQVRRYLEQARRYTSEDLTALHGELVDADRLLKQGGTGDVVLPPLVTRIAASTEVSRGVRAAALSGRRV